MAADRAISVAFLDTSPKPGYGAGQSRDLDLLIRMRIALLELGCGIQGVLACRRVLVQRGSGDPWPRAAHISPPAPDVSV